MKEKIDMKTQRVKGYFLDASKQIILNEGVENISARRIADIAGYSYATIYNYFKDIDELLRETKASIIADIVKYMQDTMDFSPNNIEALVELFKAYCQYYLDHPHVFRFFYFSKLSDTDDKNEQYDFTTSWVLTLRFLTEEGYISEKRVEECAKSIIYAVHGLLSLYFSGNNLTKELLFDDLNKIIRYIARYEK